MSDNSPGLSGKIPQRLYINSPVLGGEKHTVIFCHRCRRAYPADTKSGVWFKEMDRDGNVTKAEWECHQCDSRWSGLFDYAEDDPDDLYFGYDVEPDWEDEFYDD